ncbi:MAG: hypothetical protein SNJ67_09885, partial [Chloracidobacterium sp.]
LFTLLYAIPVAHNAVSRAFWLDELFTYYIVTMPTWAGTWDLLRNGPDQNPPLFYALTRLVVGVLGESEWAFRLPAMVGYWVFCVALYVWVRLLGGGRVAALVAMATPILTKALYYASEARPYGLVLGCLGVGLASWQMTRYPNWRGIGLFGTGTGLSTALALHYLALLPIGVLWCVEGFAAWRLRQIDRARWLALGAPLTIAGISLAFFHQQARQGFWKIVLEWRELVDFYRWLAGSPTYLALCAVVGLLVAWGRISAMSPTGRAHPTAVNLWMVTSVALLVLPLGWMLFLKATRQTVFQERYFLVSLVGLGGLTAYALRHLPERQAPVAAAAVWCLACVPAVQAGLRPWRLVPPSVAEIIALPDPTYPIVAPPHIYFPIRHYYPEQFEQLIHVDSRKRQPHSTGTGLWALQRHPQSPPWLDNDEFFSQWKENFYFVCHRTYMKHWLGEFSRRGYPIVRETPDYLVYEWQQPPSPGVSSRR